jgi:hypothetical protein
LLNNSRLSDRVALVNGAAGDIAFNNNFINFSDLLGGTLAPGAIDLSHLALGAHQLTVSAQDAAVFIRQFIVSSFVAARRRNVVKQPTFP